MADPPEPPASPPTTEAVVTDVSKAGLVRRVRLVVVAGADKDKTFASSGARAVIGTHPSAEIVLTDASVSRFHCEIAVAGGRVAVRDLGSTNGTLVNGVSVAHAYLAGNETLTLGRTQIRLDLGTEHVQIPLLESDRFGGMVGRSAAMRAVFAVLERAAASNATVLLEGETGTGKEAAAESIHRESPRREGPFVILDCGAIPTELMESELFGHERGAFTGAVASRQGAFQAASGGTVFLDEIGELAPDLQPKLLRVLERREVKPLGGNRVVPVDVRVVAATNRNLRAEVNAGRFRPDLYYRLAVVEVRLPPLRERPEDLPLLVDHILELLSAADRPEAEPLRSPAFLDDLAHHAWLGNVRELRNHIERCLALRILQAPSAGGAPVEPRLDASRPFRAARDDFERAYLEDLLRRHDNNVSAAARAAGLDRPSLYRLLWRHGMR